MRLAKWNLFIPVLALASWPIAAHDGFRCLVSAAVLCCHLCLLPCCVLFAKYNLPLVRQPAREQRYRRGHWLLAIMNVLAVLALGLPSLLSALLHNQNMMMLMWYSMLLYPIAPLVWAIGLYMVLSSRAVPPGAALPGNPE
jgi:hypothetical protein